MKQSPPCREAKSFQSHSLTISLIQSLKVPGKIQKAHKKEEAVTQVQINRESAGKLLLIQLLILLMNDSSQNFGIKET